MNLDAVCEIRLNDDPPRQGRLTVRQDVRFEQTGLPKLDPNWSTVDDAGHFHAASLSKLPGSNTERVDYPTLQPFSEHRDCDGSCGGTCGGEGYDVTLYRCVICEQQVKPGTIAGPHTFTVPGLVDWTVEVHGDGELFDRQHQRFTVRAIADGRTWLGVASGVAVNAEIGGERVHAVLALAGVGPLQQIGGAR